MTQKIKTTLFLLLPFMTSLCFFVLINGCGSGGGPKGGTLDACALLAEADPATLLGGPVEKARKLIDQHDADSAVSMCGVSAQGSGLKSVSLHLMYNRKSNNPKSASAFLEGKDFGSMGMKKPTEVKGLGDVALWTSMPGAVVLQVFWNQHYRMKVSLSGLIDPGQALEKAESVARHVMKKL